MATSAISWCGSSCARPVGFLYLGGIMATGSRLPQPQAHPDAQIEPDQLQPD